ncbi:MAG: DMT family transporter [Bacillota bacterium]
MKKLGHLAIAGMVLCWSAYYLLSAWGVEFTGSPYLTGMLLRSAALIFLTIFMVAKGAFKQLFAVKKALVPLILVGLLGFALDTFANIGFMYGSVATGTMLLKTDVLMVNLVAVIVFKEKITPKEWVFALIMFAGVLCVLDIDFKSMTFNFYDLFFILSAMAVTANAFLIKGVQKKFEVSNEVIAYYNNFVVLIAFTLASFISADIFTMSANTYDAGVILLILAGGLAQTGIYVFYYRNLRVYPVWLVKVFLLIMPIITAIVSVFAFGTTISTIQIVGMAVVTLGALGIILSQRNKHEGGQHVRN